MSCRRMKHGMMRDAELAVSLGASGKGPAPVGIRGTQVLEIKP